MFQIFEQGDFSDGCTGGAFFVFQPDLLESYQIIREPGFAFENSCVGSLKRARLKGVLFVNLGMEKMLNVSIKNPSA